MMQKSVYLAACMLVFLYMFPLAAATITVDPLNAVYNIGDDIALGFTVTRATSAHGFLTADLVCAEGNTEIYKTPLRASAGEQKRISIPAKLERFLIGNLSQRCSIVIAYGDELGRSTPFDISSEAFVMAHATASTVSPGESVLVSGIVTKKNGRPAEGIVDATIAELNVSVSMPIQGGAFNLSLPVSSRARAQTYVVLLHAYERDSEEMRSNEGRTMLSFKVPQVLTTYDIALDRIMLSPPGIIEYRVIAYDQAEDPMSIDTSISLRSPSTAAIIQEQVQTGELRRWEAPWNTMPGIWVLEANAGPMTRTKEITIAAVHNVSFILENDTLVITNKGNVLYASTVSVLIAGEPKQVPVELALGESARFKLFAPKGSHDVQITAGNQSETFESVLLTGKSVDVRNADSRLWNTSPWMWWMFLILIVGSVALHYYRKFGRRSTWGRTLREPPSAPLTPFHRASPGAAPPTENHGTKEECTVVAVHIKNLGHLEMSDGPAAQTIARVTAQGRNARAATYTQGAHKIMIFSSAAVGNQNQAAVSLARDINRILSDHNKQYALKIQYGVGLNKGPMIVEQQGGKPRFTSVGTTVVTAKRLAEHAKDSVFVSDDFYRGMIGKIKVEKVGEKQWKLKEGGVVSRNAEFLKRFYEKRS